jgi:hypothetical protein
MMMAGRHTAEGRQRQAARNAEPTRNPAAADTVSASQLPAALCMQHTLGLSTIPAGRRINHRVSSYKLPADA